jgi:transposase
MNKKIVHVGLDVDDTQYHGAALNKATGELFNFKCRPTLKGLLGQLVRIRKQFPRHVVRVVYEASYIGFTLQRDLEDKGIHCDVVAPSSIPRQGGKAVKTDRIDATQLAQFYANDLLTIVQVRPTQPRCFSRLLARTDHRELLAMMRRPSELKSGPLLC